MAILCFYGIIKTMNKDKMTLEEIGNYVNKAKGTINSWKYRNPELLECVTIGAFCKKNNLDIEKIKKLVELQELIQNSK